MIPFLFITLLSVIQTSHGCQWPNSLAEIGQEINNRQQKELDYLRNAAVAFENDNDPLYKENKLDFLAIKSRMDAQVQSLKNTPAQGRCSPDTEQQLCNILNINAKDPRKPILINSPGRGLNPATIARTAIYVDAPHFKQYRNSQFPLLAFILNHEGGHLLKHQPNDAEAKDRAVAKWYCELLNRVTRPDQRHIAASLKDSIYDACKKVDHAYEFGADYHSACSVPIEYIQEAIAHHQQLNLPETDSHPSSADRVAFLQKIVAIRMQNTMPWTK